MIRGGCWSIWRWRSPTAPRRSATSRSWPGSPPCSGRWPRTPPVGGCLTLSATPNWPRSPPPGPGPGRWRGRSAPRPPGPRSGRRGSPVGLEYSIVVVICISLLHRGLSGGDVVLVRESAEDVSSADPVLSEVDLGWPGMSLSRCELAEGTVRTGGVVMPQVFGQYPAQVVLIDDQQPVEQLPAQGADDPFADSVRYGRLWWAGENPDAIHYEHGVEGAGELACAVPDQELD